MSRLRVAANGQVTFRQALSWRLGVQPAEAPTVHKHPVGRVSDIFGMLQPKRGISPSVDEINDIAAHGSARRE